MKTTGRCPKDIAVAVGAVETPAGRVPIADTQLGHRDRMGALRVRWAIGRNRYRIKPGLYALGQPTPQSPVLVTANYKLSFDSIRGVMAHRHAWVLVLETHGINVWCAAGKGTFGTGTLVQAVRDSALDQLVSHRRLVVPQLGAAGLSAHAVQKQCGFYVVYGPVRAEDLPAFLDAGLKATPAMRRVTFPLRSRLDVVPVELVQGFRPLLALVLCFGIVSGLGRDGWQPEAMLPGLQRAALLLAAAWLTGTLLVPALLPWLPGRPFSVKGLAAGLAVTLALWLGGWLPAATSSQRADSLAWALLISCISSHLAFKYTGSTPFTSPSGVRQEMRVALPAQGVCFGLGLGLWLAARWMNG